MSEFSETELVDMLHDIHSSENPKTTKAMIVLLETVVDEATYNANAARRAQEKNDWEGFIQHAAAQQAYLSISKEIINTYDVPDLLEETIEDVEPIHAKDY